MDQRIVDQTRASLLSEESSDDVDCRLNIVEYRQQFVEYVLVIAKSKKKNLNVDLMSSVTADRQVNYRISDLIANFEGVRQSFNDSQSFCMNAMAENGVRVSDPTR